MTIKKNVDTPINEFNDTVLPHSRAMLGCLKQILTKWAEHAMLNNKEGHALHICPVAGCPTNRDGRSSKVQMTAGCVIA